MKSAKDNSRTNTPDLKGGHDFEERSNTAGSPGENTGYRVGYARPPLHSRYGPGRSGNPAGRPKGRKGLKTLILEGLEQPTKITKNRLSWIATIGEAIADALLEKAKAGDLRAIEMAMKADEVRVVEVPVPFVIGKQDAGH